MKTIIRIALACLQLDLPQDQPLQTFFRHGPVPSEDYLRDFHACLRDSRALSHVTLDGRTLASMQDAAKVGPHASCGAGSYLLSG